MGTDANTVPELGRDLSRRLWRHVPHDGFMLSGQDPITGAGCFLTEEHGYGGEYFHRLQLDDVQGRSEQPFSRLIEGPVPIATMNSGQPGFGDELRLALIHGGIAWGTLILLRESGRPSFSADELAHARQLVVPLALTVKAFVTRTAPRPRRSAAAPGVIVVGQDDRIKTATPTGRDWLRACVPYLDLPDDEALAITVWNLTFAARHGSGAALSRIPAAEGWIGLRAQLLGDSGEVAITVQAATAEVLLPAVAAWYGITRRERSVVEQALEGAPAKQIARHLDLSPHTVNDHFKAVYRKLGVHSREELVAVLSG
ncbi:helix-turn-helix transcriptional regulator [Amycolatopsis sp. H20-H5]|uniref:helix-turn-helix transcriptional regulator n=1 Tax=Amycolatopsis sp. H20-H5 TaxID=3046309 RepID=UPI002DB8F42A|nr:helix-turn-helix transcriptional regulator [Amycolatopsis sp. H20-H5]MEC3974842.1 helix-turn-helix transcriptional regulator [Amycolatopsis sp. H20-H5]